MSELVVSGQNIARVELDTQIATAKAYPRDVANFPKKAISLLTVDQQTAESCIYSLKRKGKSAEGKQIVNEITGPSIRFAEVICHAWGNMHCGVRSLPDSDPKSVILEGVAWDLENNVRISKQVRRPTVTKDGYAYGTEMRTTTENAGASIALRNAILVVIPPVITKSIYEAVKKEAIGDVSTADKLLQKAQVYLKRFNKMGIPNERIFTYFDIKNEAEITEEHIIEMIGIGTRIADKQLTIEEAFIAEMQPDHEKAASIDEKLKKPEAKYTKQQIDDFVKEME